MEIEILDGIVIVDGVRYAKEQKLVTCSRCNTLTRNLKDMHDDAVKLLEETKEDIATYKEDNFSAERILAEGFAQGLRTFSDRLRDELDRIEKQFSSRVDSGGEGV